VKVLVTFAVPAEFAPWRARHAFSPSAEVAQPGTRDYFFYEGYVGKSDVRVLLTGMGGQNTGLRMNRALWDVPDFCISSGLAGGLSEMCRAGDVVAARRTSRGGTTSSIASNEYLVQSASRCGAKPVSRFVTVEQIVGDSAQKRAMASSGDVVEMESYFVLRAAAGAHVPAVAVRAISDAVEEDLPMDFSRVLDSQGAVKVRRLVGELAREPRRIPRLVRFGMRSRRAALALADFLDRYLLALDHDRKNAESIALREVAAT
jgi:adenosylhomocysteine nucleosidase